MANAIVVEVLDFVRPIRLQVEHIAAGRSGPRRGLDGREPRGAAGDVEVSRRLPDDLPPIQGDPHQLRQIFTNLLTNAFEAMDGAGTVGIAASQLAGRRGSRPVGSDVRRCR